MKYATHQGDTGRWLQRYDITLDESSLCGRVNEIELFIWLTPAL